MASVSSSVSSTILSTSLSPNIFDHNIMALRLFGQSPDGHIRVNSKESKLSFEPNIGIAARQLCNVLHKAGFKKSSYRLTELHDVLLLTAQCLAEQVGRGHNFSGGVLRRADINSVEQICEDINPLVIRILASDPAKGERYRQLYNQIELTVQAGEEQCSAVRRAYTQLKTLHSSISDAFVESEREQFALDNIFRKEIDSKRQRLQSQVHCYLHDLTECIDSFRSRLKRGEIIPELLHITDTIQNLRERGETILMRIGRAQEHYRLHFAVDMTRHALQLEGESTREFSNQLELEISQLETQLQETTHRLSLLKEGRTIQNRLCQIALVLPKARDDRSKKEFEKEQKKLQKELVNLLGASISASSIQLEMQKLERDEILQKTSLSDNQTKLRDIYAKLRRLDDLISRQVAPLCEVSLKRGYIVAGMNECEDFRRYEELFAQELNRHDFENEFAPLEPFNPIIARYWLQRRLF